MTHFTARQIQTGRFARTEQIVLRHTGRQHHAVVLRPADTGVQAAGGAFFHHHVHVHLLLVFGHGGHVGLHVFKIAQLAQAFHGTVDFGLVVCRAFHLAQFAADDFVARFVVAANVDVAHGNAVAQSSLHFDIDKMLAVFFAACRRSRYLRLRITGRLQFQTDFGQHFVQFVQIAQFACSDGRQMALNRSGRHVFQIARQTDVTPIITLALINFDGDVFTGFVFGKLAAETFFVQAEIEIAALMVKRFQTRFIAGEFFP